MSQVSFNLIPDSIVILVKRGVFSQTQAYEYKGFVYDKTGAGYVRILRNQSTTVPDLRWDNLELGFEPKYDKVGYLLAP